MLPSVVLSLCPCARHISSVSQGRICSDNFTCCHTEIEVTTLPSHSILTPGRPVPALILYRQAPGRVATGVPVLKSLVCLDPEKFRRKREPNPGSSAPEGDALTARPTRRCLVVMRLLRELDTSERVRPHRTATTISMACGMTLRSQHPSPTWNPQGKRKRGRPRNSCRRDTEAELKQQGTNWSGMTRAAQMRWRGGR